MFALNSGVDPIVNQAYGMVAPRKLLESTTSVFASQWPRESPTHCRMFPSCLLTDILHGHSAPSGASCRHFGGPSCRRTARIVLEKLSGATERPMIIPMTTTGRPQQRYDHRLRDLVLGTGDVTIAWISASLARRPVGSSARSRRSW